MALVPMNQSVTIIKAGLDEWGQPTSGQISTYSCRIDQSSELVRTADGKEIVSSFKILLDGQVQIEYSDLIEWEETGNMISRNPISIAVIRDFAGKPLLTKVVV